MKRINLSMFLILVMFLLNCGNGKGGLHKKLNGTWKNKLMTVTFDWNKKVYSGVMLGQEFSKKLTLVKEEGNVVTFKSGNKTIICQIQDDDNILMTKKGKGIPLTFKRIK